MAIEQFPVKPKNIRGKSQLAWWLRKLADLVENDQLEVEPHAALLMFVGNDKTNSSMLAVLVFKRNEARSFKR
ncbi:TPA: hypothetical protein ACMDO3_000049 [Vibrio metschnikovii]